MAVEYALFGLAVGLFIVFIAIWSIHFMALIYGKYKFHKKNKRTIEKDKLPGVSIIKPLMGADDNLRDNLETFFTIDYPLFELLFCVQDNTDPAISVVKHLLEKYPSVDAKLFSGGKNVGINPKINNMIQGYEVAKYEHLLISDAGLKMSKDTLTDMVSLMTEKVGLVHQMPFVNDRPGFAGSLEKVYFGTCHSRMYLFINLIGINCVTGMSCLMRKSVIDKEGGLQKFGNYIAEDFFLAKAFIDNNWIIQLSHQPAIQNSATYSVPSWQKRMIRWCKLRLKLSPMAWFEPIQECFMLGLATSWTVNYLFGWNSLVFFLIHVLGWFLSDYLLLKIVQNGKLPFSKFDYVISWFYRESICLYLFVKAASNPTVKWRDGKYLLKWGGLAEEIKDEKAETKAIAQPASSSPSSSSTASLANGGSKKIEQTVGVSSTVNETIAKNNNVNTNGSMNNININKSNLLASSTINKSSNNLAQITNNPVSKLSNQNHKRTNSYTLSNNNLNSKNHNNYINSYELENNFKNINNNSIFINKNSLNIPLINNNNHQSKGFSNQIKSNHQQHHSISSPFNNSSSFHQPLIQLQQQQPSLQSQQQIPINGGALLELSDSKFSNFKIV